MDVARYFDHNATTPVLLSIQDEVAEFIKNEWANPSATYLKGREEKIILQDSRKALADWLKIDPLEWIFTSGASESNALVFYTLDYQSQDSEFIRSHGLRKKIITSSIEHPSVIENAKFLSQKKGYQWVQIPISKEGNIDYEYLENQIDNSTLLVSFMAASNETGLVFDIQKIAKMAKNQGAYFHTDATQALGKIDLNLEDVDYASFSAHKVNAFKGIGGLVVKNKCPLLPLIKGGGQERFRRAGTENIMGVWSFKKAAEFYQSGQKTLEFQNIKKMRDDFELKILESLGGVQVTHQSSLRLPNTTHLFFDDIQTQSLLINLDLKGYAVSVGSACSSGALRPSQTLLGMGYSARQALQGLRVSFGLGNKSSEIDQFILEIKNSVAKTRSISKPPSVLFAEEVKV